MRAFRRIALIGASNRRRVLNRRRGILSRNDHLIPTGLCHPDRIIFSRIATVTDGGARTKISVFGGHPDARAEPSISISLDTNSAARRTSGRNWRKEQEEGARQVTQFLGHLMSVALEPLLQKMQFGGIAPNRCALNFLFSWTCTGNREAFMA